MNSGRQRAARRPLVVDAATSARLGRVRQTGTAPELAVRALLRQLGIRSGRTRRQLPGSPDIVNLSAGWCIFVHGCFWRAHSGCQRATLPRRNNAFWRAKFTANRSRDARVLRQLRANGLKALVVWECDAELRPAIVRRRLATHLAPTSTAGGSRTGRRGAGSSSRS
jgi:DNA mismatch endonuclease Vsr